MTEDHDVRVVDLKTEDDSGLVASAFAGPRLSWRLEGSRPGIAQAGYEIEVGKSLTFEDGDVERSGVVRSPSPLLARWPGASLASRDVRFWRVRATTDAGLTAWSAPSRYEASLLKASDWIARPVSPRSNIGRASYGPPPLLRREFTLDTPVKDARLYVTALGLHDVEINGRAISGDLLEPGWTSYGSRLLFAAYDVTSLLKKGANAISGMVGDGWWRGDLTWTLKRNTYGDTSALLLQLEVTLANGSRVLIATDESWRGSYGSVESADLYQGARIDFRKELTGWRLPGFDVTAWEGVTVLPLPKGLEARSMPAVRVLERRILEIATPKEPGGKLMVDVGQNITGFLTIKARGESGATVEVRHAEMLDTDGSLLTAPLRKARATDNYVLDGGARRLSPPFTFHGFRYASIDAPGVVIDGIEAVVIASDLKLTGTFECSDARLNRLFLNAFWSQRGNFLSVPTDCPQRDERLGWTGDIQAFAPTASMNADTRAFLLSWLKDLGLDQRDDGAVPSVVPDVLPDGMLRYGAAAWGDAATFVPWTLYRAYGDLEVLKRQFPGMCAWVDWCALQRDADGLWMQGAQFGDWLDPDAPGDKPHKAKCDRRIVATSYIAMSAKIVARAARLISDEAGATRYERLSGQAATATWLRWHDEMLTTQTGCALAIEFGIAPEHEHMRVGEALAALVKANRYRIGTGFVGTPLVLSALANTGQIDAAYRMLLNTECPGWLYQVDAGATTIWERWDAIKPDGTLHIGEMALSGNASMISYNHYAYGAVVHWMYKYLAGISIDFSAEEESVINFAPRPGGGLRFARAEIVTPYGPAKVGWRHEEGTLDIETTVPAGARARFVAPEGFAGPREPVPSILGSGMRAFRFTAT
jgi:alpha-L-rhamnosidase